MSSTGSISASPNGLLMALVQYEVPVVNKPEDVQASVDRIAGMVGRTKAAYPDLDLIVFPEYSSSGLNTALWSYDEFLIAVDSPQVDQYRKACRDAGVWGVFSIMEPNHEAGKPPFNTAIIIDDSGEIALHYRKLQPWVPIEPWYPGDLGMPVCDGPKGSRLAVSICHDGMFPELAREAAYNGANVYIRISGYSTQVQDQWILTNRSNAFQNLMFTASVNLAGYDGSFYYFGEGNVVNYDGAMISEGHRNPMEIVTAEIFPELADLARKNWGLENNVYNLGARGYVATPGGLTDNYLNWVRDLAEGNYHVPWEDEVRIKDGWKYYPNGPQLGPMPR